jgi:hypothetical protein
LESISLKLTGDQRIYQKAFSTVLPKDITKVEALKVLESINNNTLGSSFIYIENKLWNNVKSDPSYQVTEDIENCFGNFLISEVLDDCTNVLFVGPGDGSEVSKFDACNISSGFSSHSYVDISTSMLLDLSINAEIEKDAIFYSGDFTSKDFITEWNSDNASTSSLTILKGGTSCNVSIDQFCNFINHIDSSYFYFDFFINNHKNNYKNNYINDNVKILALYNYMRIFDIFGVDSSLTGVHSSTKDVLPEFASLHSDNIDVHIDYSINSLVVSFHYNIPHDLKRSLLNKIPFMEIPSNIQIFSSRRYQPNYVLTKLIQTIPNLEVLNIFTSNSVYGVLCRK